MTTTNTPAAPARCANSVRGGEHLHFLHVRCPDCTAVALQHRNLDEVESWAEQGIISTDARDGYRHVWAISAERHGNYQTWMARPTATEAAAVADALTALLPSGRGYC
jgi:hypothetical protein